MGLGLLMLLSGCQFNILGKNGNGNVITQERGVSENFTGVRGSAGMNVFLTQGSENEIVVEADENLLPYIETTVEDGKLHITTSENIGRAKAKKVYVTFIALNNIEASSGAEVTGNSVIKSENLSLRSSSGGELKVEVFSKDLSVQSSSGGEIDIAGKASNFVAKASSGGEVDAKKLLTLSCKAKVSSGGEIVVNVRDTLDSQVSSGGEIKYYGNPASVKSNKSTSGSLRKM